MTVPYGVMDISRQMDGAGDVNAGVVQFLFASPERILNLPPIDAARQEFSSAVPYPHLVIDNFLTDEAADLIKRILVGRDRTFAVQFNDDVQKNKTISTGDDVPQLLQALAGRLSSPYMLQYLEQLTGEKSILADPYYNTSYGFYHITSSGGVLGPHVDHSHHQSIGIRHNLTLVLYISPDWREENGGTFVIFDGKGATPQRRVACRFNRALIFACSPIAYHGVEPVAEGAPHRHSLNFSYYQVEPASVNALDVLPAFSASRNDTGIRYGTYFKLSWRQLFKRQNRHHLRGRINNFMVLVTPPAVVLVKRKIKAMFAQGKGH